MSVSATRLRVTLGAGLVLATVLAVPAWADEIDLREPPESLRFTAQALPGMPCRRARSVNMGTPVARFDVDGDGADDLIFSRNADIVASTFRAGHDVVFYQKPLPPRFAAGPAEEAACGLLLCPDLTRPGETDLVAWTSVPDASLWRFWVLDPATGKTRREFDLPGGEDVRADGRWDGNYFAVGATTSRRDGELVPALLIGCNVGYDLYGRGVLAVDPTDGAVLWRFDMGPNPSPWNVRAVDLGGDPRLEIVAIGRSPGNLGGRLINGTTDDETRLFVLDADGRLRWDRTLGEAFGNAELAIGDMTGNGRPEIITVTRATPSLKSSLSVWSNSGLEVARLEGEGQWMGVHIVRRRDRVSPSLLVADGPHLMEFDFAERSLRERRRATLPAETAINLVDDFLPEPGVETVVSVRHDARYVLDQNLAPLLRVANARGWTGGALVWHVDAAEPALIWPNTNQPVVRVTGAPLTWVRWKPWALGLGAVALLVVVAVGVRHLIPVSPAGRRAARLHLLERIELSNHGSIAPLKTFHRLAWHLEALQSPATAKEALIARLRETRTACRQTALPALAEILDGARHTGIAAATLQDARRAVANLADAVDRVSDDDLAPDTLAGTAAVLNEAVARTSRILLQMRREVTAGLRTAVAPAVQRTLEANELGLMAVGVEVTAARAAHAVAGGIGDRTDPAPLHVLCDSQELDYVLDNLVANAIAAMARTTRRHLTISWYQTDGMVVIDVSDTGCGLGPEEGDRALKTRYSTKTEGGAGLPNSLKYLRKYGGSLTIAAAEPGRGATFRVTLPCA